MVQKTWILTRLDLQNFLGLNVLRHERDRTARMKKGLCLGAVGILLLYVICSMGVQAWMLCKLHMGHLVPGVLLLAVTGITFLVSLFGSSLYEKRGYELLCSLPISGAALALGRILGTLFRQLLLGLVIAVPGLTVWGMTEMPGISGLLALLLGALAMSVFSVSLALSLETGILWISGTGIHKKALQSFSHTLLMVLILGLPLLHTASMLNNHGDLLSNLEPLLRASCPWAAFLGNLLSDGKIGAFLGVLTGIMALSILLLALICRIYTAVCTRAFTDTMVHRAYKSSASGGTCLGALYRKEWKLYFSCPIYVSNTIMGPILATALSAGLLFLDLSPLEAGLPVDPVWLLPAAWSMVCCLMTAASVSISMEGSRIWILRSLPVRMKDLINAKLLFNLSLMAPFYAVSELLLFLKFRPEFLKGIWLLLVPIVLMAFSCVFGLSANLRFPNFRWQKPEEVVKQGASSALGGLCPALLCLISGGLLLILPSSAYYCLIPPALGIITWMLYRDCIRKTLSD